ncbi:MAG: glycosyltransferase family 39 protein [Oenococcus oeni]
MKLKMETLFRIINIGFLFIFLLLCVFNSQIKYVWNDESFTLSLIPHSYLSILSLTAKDVHPFLYYWIAKFLSFGTTNIYSLIVIERLVSLLPYLLLLLISFTYIRRFWGQTVSLIFSVSVLLMPGILQYGEQIRMYSWAIFFVTCVFLNALLILKSDSQNRYWIGLSVFSIFAAYTHYYGFLDVIFIYFILLLCWKNLRFTFWKYLLSVAVDLLIFLPWIPIFLHQVSGVSADYWIGKFGLKQIIEFVLFPFTLTNSIPGYLVAALLFFIIAAGLFIFLKEHRTHGSNREIQYFEMLGGIFPTLLVILAGTLISYVDRPILISRYLVPGLGIFWFSVSILISKSDHKNFKKILLIAVLCLGLLNSIAYTRRLLIENQTFQTSSNFFKQMNKKAILIYDNSVTMFVSSYYLQNNQNFVLEHRNHDVTFNLYQAVYPNITETSIQRSKTLLTSKHVYFIEASKNSNRLHESQDKHKFLRYVKKHFMLKKQGQYQLPLDGDFNVYRVSGKSK